MTTIAKLNKALAAYYERLGDDSYFDDERGKFAAHCEDTGFEEDDVIDELSQEPEECAILEFDSNFPFEKEINDNDEKLKQIHQILNNIITDDDIELKDEIIDEISEEMIKSKHRIHPSPKQLISKIPSDDIKKKAKLLYKKQMFGTLGEKGLRDDTLLEFLAVSLENNDYPFLSNLVDSFIRDRVNYRNKGNIKAFNALDWAEINPFISYITETHRKRGEDLSSAVKSYCSRICPKLQFKPLFKIKDDLNEISRYIAITTRFIYNLLQQKSGLPPLQFDLIIAVKDVFDAQKKMLPQFSDDDDEEEEEEDNNDDDDDKKEQDLDSDYIGDVKMKLLSEKLNFMKDKIKQINDGSNVDGMTRFMMNSYSKFRKEARNNKFDYNDDDGTDGDDDDDYKQKDTLLSPIRQYPHNRRFCAFIDRRIDKKKNDKKHNKKDDDDEIIWFDPPSNCCKLPRNHVPEWGFEAVRKCLIPRKGYNSGKNDEKNVGMNVSVEEKRKLITINGLTGCKGQILTFSFMVESIDEIKCYLYWMGQVMRFYPQDIIEVLPLIFDLNVYKNNKFATSDIGREIAYKIRLHDFQFEQFYRSVSNKTENDFPKYSIYQNK